MIYLIFILFDILDYSYYYYSSKNRDTDKWGGYTNYFEFNPCLNNLFFNPQIQLQI